MGRFEVGVKAAILCKRKILLVQRADHSWELPGGKMEFGEDLHTALHREIKEETGLESVRIDKLLYAVTFPMNLITQAVGLMYLCHAESDEVRISDEHSDFMWANKEQLITTIHDRMLNELSDNLTLDSLEID